MTDMDKLGRLRGSRGRRVITASVVALAVGVGQGGCSVPRGGNSATSEIAGCAAVLPLAHDTVHGVGALVVIHSLGRDDAAAIYRELGAPPLPAPPPPSPAVPPPAPPAGGQKPPKTCVVVYQGDYRPGSVTGADPAATGRYALIIVRVRHPVVDRVLLVADLPRSLPGN